MNCFIAPYHFVIDTKDYAGNFERALCAYVTGQVGDCEVGKEYAEMFAKEVTRPTRAKEECPFDNVMLEPDESNGCMRPASIYKSEGGKFNSVAIAFRIKPTKNQIDLMVQRAFAFAKLPYRWNPGKGMISEIVSFRLISSTTKTKCKSISTK